MNTLIIVALCLGIIVALRLRNIIQFYFVKYFIKQYINNTLTKIIHPHFIGLAKPAISNITKVLAFKIETSYNSQNNKSIRLYSECLTDEAINAIFIYLTSGLVNNNYSRIINILREYDITYEKYQQFCTSLHDSFLDDIKFSEKQKDTVLDLAYILRQMVINTLYHDGYFKKNNNYNYPEGFTSDDYILGFSGILIDSLLNSNVDCANMPEQEKYSMVCAIFLLLFGKDSIPAITKYSKHLCLLKSNDHFETSDISFISFCEGAYAAKLWYKAAHNALGSEKSTLLDAAYELSEELKKDRPIRNNVTDNKLPEAIQMLTIRNHINQKYIM